jgi:hypothetical protein
MVPLQTDAKLRQFLFDLPFPEKKRLVESIISPEQGGKCFVQYITPSDYLSSTELAMLPKEIRHAPQKDQNPYAHGEFTYD